MYCWRITKYDPKLRDINGSYILDEWTEYSDIESMIRGKKLTFQEYEVIEKKYIQAIVLFFDDLKITSLSFHFLKKIKQGFDKYANDDMRKIFYSLSKETKVTRLHLESIIQLSLRDYIGAILVNEDLIIQFEYDFYVYIGARKDCASIIDKVHHLGLFAEPLDYYYYIGQAVGLE